MWKEYIHECDEKSTVQYNQPATKEELEAFEQDFEIVLPEDLRGYLLEANGDDTLMMSVERMFDINTQLREECAATHMPLDCLVFVAENGCGGYYGYPVIKGKIAADKIYFWWRETDDRTFVATDLRDFFTKYFHGEI